MSNGLLASLNMSVDRGDVTSGNVFSLDDKQKEVIRLFQDHEVCLEIFLIANVELNKVSFSEYAKEFDPIWIIRHWKDIVVG